MFKTFPGLSEKTQRCKKESESKIMNTAVLLSSENSEKVETLVFKLRSCNKDTGDKFPDVKK